MIQLTRLNGSIIAINPDLITWIEVTPDTTIALLNGDRVMVRETLDEVMHRVVEFRRSVHPPDGSDAHPPSREVFRAMNETPGAAPERPSRRPSAYPRHGG